MVKKAKKTNWELFAVLGTLGASIFGIWKTSKIGKVIFLFLICGVLFGVVLKGVGGYIDLYYTKVKYRNYISKEMEPIEKNITILKSNVAKLTADISELDRTMQDTVTDRIDNSVKSLADKLEEKYYDVIAVLDEVQKAADLIKEEERKQLKHKIIMLKEDVTIHEKSIESSEIRIKCEDLVDKLFLLTQTEKKRFYKDLKDIGFEVEVQSQNIRKIYSDSYSVMSCDVMMYEHIDTN